MSGIVSATHDIYANAIATDATNPRQKAGFSGALPIRVPTASTFAIGSGTDHQALSHGRGESRTQYGREVKRGDGDGRP